MSKKILEYMLIPSFEAECLDYTKNVYVARTNDKKRPWVVVSRHSDKEYIISNSYARRGWANRVLLQELAQAEANPSFIVRKMM